MDATNRPIPPIPAHGRDEKTCARCRHTLSAAAFGDRIYASDGKDSYCRDCRAAYNAAYRAGKGSALNAARRDRRARLGEERALLDRLERARREGGETPAQRRVRKALVARIADPRARRSWLAYHQVWQHRHPEARRRHTARYRAALRDIAASPPPSDLEAALAFDPGSSTRPARWLLLLPCAPSSPLPFDDDDVARLYAHERGYTVRDRPAVPR